MNKQRIILPRLEVETSPQCNKWKNSFITFSCAEKQKNVIAGIFALEPVCCRQNAEQSNDYVKMTILITAKNIWHLASH